MRYEDDLDQGLADWNAVCAQLEDERREKEPINYSEDSYEWECGWYTQILKRQHTETKMKEERWAEFLAFNTKKPPHRVWNATKMNELLK